MSDYNSHPECNCHELVDPEQLSLDVGNTEMPVLVACLHEGGQWDELIAELESACQRLEGRVILRIINCTRYPESVDQLGLLGTPSYIMFVGGRETGRLIGRADSLALMALAGSVTICAEDRTDRQTTAGESSD